MPSSRPKGILRLHQDEPGDGVFRCALSAGSGNTLWTEQEWDLDNLIKAFFDALTDVAFCGPPVHPQSPLKGNERIDHMDVTQRRGGAGEALGALMGVWLIAPASGP